MWIARPTQHVVSLRFSHQKGYQHAEQRGLLHDKANVPAGRVHCRCISSDLIWQLPVIYTGICQITSGLNFSRPRCVFHQVTFPLAFAHCTFFPDGFAHYYSEPAIHQDPTVMYQDRRTVFYETLPDKIRSVLFYGIARRCRWSAGTSPSFSCVLCRLLPDKADNHAALLCHSTPCLCRSIFSASAGPETHKTVVHDRSVSQPQ